MSVRLNKLALGGDSVDIIDATIDGTGVDPQNGRAILRMTTAGEQQVSISSSGIPIVYTTIKQAIIPGGNAGNYEVMLSSVTGSGGNFAGTVDSWIALSANVTWTLTTIIMGMVTRSGTLNIRPIGGSTLDTAAITFMASKESGG